MSEQDKFEAWMASCIYPDQETADAALERMPNGEYKYQITLAAWLGWRGAINNNAAPELLEALKEILDYSGGAENALEDEYVVDRARTAIAKAEGRDP